VPAYLYIYAHSIYIHICVRVSPYGSTVVRLSFFGCGSRDRLSVVFSKIDFYSYCIQYIDPKDFRRLFVYIYIYVYIYMYVLSFDVSHLNAGQKLTRWSLYIHVYVYTYVCTVFRCESRDRLSVIDTFVSIYIHVCIYIYVYCLSL